MRMQRLQGVLPLNPQALAGVAPDLAFNTAASFTTNTNWQSLRRRDDDELPDADGGAGVPQLRVGGDGHRPGDRLRARHRRERARLDRQLLGRFHARHLWVLLPFCLVGALLLVSQGVVQNFKPYDRVKVVDPQTVTATDAQGVETKTVVTEQVIAQGPVASQEVIKEWGTNGGGFFNANSAHPFENPTPLTNFIEMLLRSSPSPPALPTRWDR